MGVKTEIVERVTDLLAEYFATREDIGVVKAGPLHDDPTRKEKSILIREIDPLSLDRRDDTWMDRRYIDVPERERDFGMSDEIGGNKVWYLRIIIELNINYARRKQDREDAFQDSDTVKDEIIDVIDGANIYFAEGRWVVYTIFVKRIQVLERGGAGAWQWRYALYCQSPAMHLAE
jgi:hypothetical protein